MRAMARPSAGACAACALALSVAACVLVGCPPRGAESATRWKCVPRAADAPWRGKRLQLWTTACDPAAEETKALLAGVARAGVHLDALGLACTSLRDDGGLELAGGPPAAAARAALLTELAERGIATALVIANVDRGDFDGARGAAILGDPTRHAALVEAVLALEASERHAIVEIDLEELPTPSAADLVRFVEALRARLPSEVRVVVDVHPKTKDDPGWTGPGAHDYAGLARAGAELRAMTYDYSLGPQPPGPTTSAAWIRDVVAYARGVGVPAARLQIGLPAYGYDFAPVPAGASSSAASVGWHGALALQARERATLVRDAGGAPHFAYRGDDGRHEVWFDDAESIARLLADLSDVAKDVDGVAIWGAGGADPQLLDAWTCAAK